MVYELLKMAIAIRKQRETEYCKVKKEKNFYIELTL